MSNIQSDVVFNGFGESSDAHHISAPHPEGHGAAQAMLSALNRAGLSAQDINYINLHGTGTVQNDAMEAKAVSQVFKQDTLCSASKQLHGHCLGAAGAIEAGLCWLLLSEENTDNLFPIMKFSDDFDKNIDKINLISESHQPAKTLQHCMSNSYAFGGNNASLILSKSSAFSPI